MTKISKVIYSKFDLLKQRMTANTMTTIKSAPQSPTTKPKNNNKKTISI